MPLVTLTTTIAQGESESTAADCNGDLVRITMPADWTSAHLSFLTSADNIAYHDVANHTGDYAAINVVPDSAIFMPEAVSRGIKWLKLRSGTKENPVPQEAARTFTLVIDQGGAAALTSQRKINKRGGAKGKRQRR